MVSKQGLYYYNFWKDAKHKRGLWRRTTLEGIQEGQSRLGKSSSTLTPSERGPEKDELGLAWSGKLSQPRYERFF